MLCYDHCSGTCHHLKQRHGISETQGNENIITQNLNNWFLPLFACLTSWDTRLEPDLQLISIKEIATHLQVLNSFIDLIPKSKKYNRPMFFVLVIRVIILRMKQALLLPYSNFPHLWPSAVLFYPPLLASHFPPHTQPSMVGGLPTGNSGAPQWRISRESNNDTQGPLLLTPAQFRQWSLETCEWHVGRSARQVKTKMKTKCWVSVGNMSVRVCVCDRLQTCLELSFNTCVGGFQGRLLLSDVFSVCSLSESKVQPNTDSLKTW